jgi:hypothetical protein
MNALALRKSNRTAKISRLLKRPTYRVAAPRTHRPDGCRAATRANVQ